MLPKETIHGNIPWLNTYADENVTIDPIMNAMMLAQIMFHILQQGLGEGTPSFETPNQVIKNISKDIDVIAQKDQTQKCK